jgi:hypothetical protein
MDITEKFNQAAQKIEYSIRKFNINPKYLIVLSFILTLKAYFELINSKLLTFIFLMIISQFIVEVYKNNINYQKDKNEENYHLLNQKLNYIKLILFVCIIFLKFGKSISFLNILIVILAFILYIYYSPCYASNLTQSSETDFKLLNGKDKIKTIFKNRNKIFNNFMFNDICTLIYLLLIVIIFSLY